MRDGEARYLTLCQVESSDPSSLLQKLQLEEVPKKAQQGRMIDYINCHLMSAWELIDCRSGMPAVQQADKRLGGTMPRPLFLALINCTDPMREDEFNEWYSNTHIPDLLRDHPGIVRGCRYRRLKTKSEQSEPGYLTIYETYSEDPFELSRQVVQGDKGRAEQGRMIDFAQVWFEGVFDHISL